MAVQNTCYDWSHKCILVAEDYEDTFIIIKALLKKTNIHIIHAKTGLEAIEVLKKNPTIDVILMDITMPELNGVEAARQIRTFNTNTFILADTAHDESLTSHQIDWSVFDAVINKPILRKELFAKLDKFLS